MLTRRGWRRRSGRRLAVAAALAAALAPLTACTGDAPAAPPSTTAERAAAGQATRPSAPSPTGLGTPTGTPTATVTAPSRGASSPTPTASTGATTAPAWLGTRVLPKDEDGVAVGGRTPPELVDRRIVTVDELPPPTDAAFRSTVTAVPVEVAVRSTWTTGCPVALDDLRYVTVTFRGFDGRAHTGELLVHRSVAKDVVTVFRRLFEADYPIERMRVITPEELDASPTGDGNTTSSFVCRSAVGGRRWSEHAYGLAIDVNPFHNPYVKGSRVLPELAGAYADRRRGLPGMITAGGPAVRAFRAAGWQWGGDWRSAKDYMHFSVNGR